MTIKIRLSSILVDDQEKALRFYTDKLGFVTKHDIPLGEFRWLTVVSPEEEEGTELVLEPNANPACLVYQKAIFDQGIPLTALWCRNVDQEHARLQGLGVRFRQPPTDAGPVKIAVLDDTCGNYIQLFSEQAPG